MLSHETSIGKRKNIRHQANVVDIGALASITKEDGIANGSLFVGEFTKDN